MQVTVIRIERSLIRAATIRSSILFMMIAKDRHKISYKLGLVERPKVRPDNLYRSMYTEAKIKNVTERIP